jgi:AhpD family alkylhydroperoxidase
MQARMTQPALTLPGLLPALTKANEKILASGLSPRLAELVNLRVSQINGCSVCAQMHASALQKEGESLERLFTLAAWRDAPYFTDAERAALALAEAETRIADVADPVTDAVWEEARAHYDETQLCALVAQIALINLWNRLNVATRQVAGAWAEAA